MGDCAQLLPLGSILGKGQNLTLKFVSCLPAYILAHLSNFGMYFPNVPFLRSPAPLLFL